MAHQGSAMPFSSLSDPAALARAQAALDAVWAEVRDSIAAQDQERERLMLAYVIVSAVREAKDHAEVVRIALETYRNKQC